MGIEPMPLSATCETLRVIALARDRGDFGSPLSPSIKGLHRSPLKPASGAFAPRDHDRLSPLGYGAALPQGRLRLSLGTYRPGQARPRNPRGWREAGG